MVTKIINKPITLQDLYTILNKLKPSKVIFTNDEELYNKIMELPAFNKELIKLTKLVDGTYLVDMDKVNKQNSFYPYF